jgi:large subunit ribosomal protein L25
MKEVLLRFETGREVGTGAARRLRSRHLVPGVIYGKGVGSHPIAIEASHLREVLAESGQGRGLLRIEWEGSTRLALFREIQVHPVKRKVQHVDIMVVDPAKRMVFEVPVVLKGEATAVEREGGRVEQLLFRVPVRTYPTSIPEALEGDVSSLTIGGVLKVGDLSIPEGVEVDADPEVGVAVGQPPRVPRARAQAAAGQAAGPAPEVEEAGGSPPSAETAQGTPEEG